MSKTQEASSILRVGFVCSKWPHLHRAYLVTVCNRTFIAVCTLLSCSVIVIEVTWDNVKICFFFFFKLVTKSFKVGLGQFNSLWTLYHWVFFRTFLFDVYFLFVALFLSQMQGTIKKLLISFFPTFFQKRSHTVVWILYDFKGRSNVVRKWTPLCNRALISSFCA